MADLRQTLSPAARKVVAAVVRQFETELIEAFPELSAGCQTSARSGSFSATLSVKGGKKDRFKGELGTRVRTPREKTEFDMHLSDDGQLALGLPPGWQEDPDDDEGGEGGEE